jgi:peroxiredoxin
MVTAALSGDREASQRRSERRRAWTALWVGLSLVLCAGLPTPAAALEPGDEAPGFTLPVLDGEGSVSLDRYRGKVVWLDFWASWCPPCLMSLPRLEDMRKEIPAKDFQIVAINVDHDPKKALKFLAKNPVGYPSASDPEGGLPTKYGLETMPTSYLIDRMGVIRVVHKGFREGDIEKIRSEVIKHVKGGKR